MILKYYNQWPHSPTIMVDGIITPKSKKDDLDKKMDQLNIKAIKVHYCSLDANEFNRISTYISIKANHFKIIDVQRC